MSLIANVWDLFQKGGLVMYPLLFCSILVVAVAIERYAYYRRAHPNSAELLEKVHENLQKKNWDGAALLCAQGSGVIAKVLAKGLRCKTDAATIAHSIEGAAAIEAANLRRHLGYLDTIVTLAPLLGLLGTVIGMIGSFSVFNVKQGSPSAITGGIGEALVATASGLCVAVLALVVHSYFSHRLDAIITDVEQACSLVMDQVKEDCS